MDLPVLVFLAGLALFLIGFEVGRGWVPFWTQWAESRAAELPPARRVVEFEPVARWGLGLPLRCGVVGHLVVSEYDGGRVAAGEASPVERTAINAGAAAQVGFMCYVVEISNEDGALSAFAEQDGPSTDEGA